MAGLRRGGEERGGELFVEAEEVFDAFAVGVEGLGAVAFLDGAIEFGVGLGEKHGHGERVVKIGQRRKAARRPVRFARGEDGSRGYLHPRPKFRRGIGPGEVFVSDLRYGSTPITTNGTAGTPRPFRMTL